MGDFWKYENLGLLSVAELNIWRCWLFIRLLPLFFLHISTFLLYSIKLINTELSIFSSMMTMRRVQGEWLHISVGTNLFIKASIYFRFWTRGINCISITKEQLPLFLQGRSCSFELNFLKYFNLVSFGPTSFINCDQKHPSNLPQIIQQSKLATFWHTITIWCGSKNTKLWSHFKRSKKRTNVAIQKSPTWVRSILVFRKNQPLQKISIKIIILDHPKLTRL